MRLAGKIGQTALAQTIKTGGTLMQSYLLLANSHDGSSSVQVKFTPVRVVCANTLNWALSDGQGGLQIRHDRSMRSRLVTARCFLEFILREFGNAQEHFAAMRQVRMNTGALAGHLKAILPDPRRTDDEDAFMRRMTIIHQRRDTAIWLFEHGEASLLIRKHGLLHQPCFPQGGFFWPGAKRVSACRITASK